MTYQWLQNRASNTTAIKINQAVEKSPNVKILQTVTDRENLKNKATTLQYRTVDTVPPLTSNVTKQKAVCVRGCIHVNIPQW